MSAAFSSRSDSEAAHALASTRVFDRTMRTAHDLATLVHDQVGTLGSVALLGDPSDDRADEAAAVATLFRQIADRLDGISRDVRPARLPAAA